MGPMELKMFLQRVGLDCPQDIQLVKCSSMMLKVPQSGRFLIETPVQQLALGELTCSFSLYSFCLVPKLCYCTFGLHP